MSAENSSIAVRYDGYGRMRYNPEIHFSHGKPWLIADQNYLVDFYEKLGPSQISFDLGRTIHTVMDRACGLRKKGLMAKRSTTTKHRRYG